MALSCWVLAIALGCGGSSTSQADQATSHIKIQISPVTLSLNPGATQRFTATVQGTSNTAVNWAASAGSIGSDGTFAAPTLKDGTQITITAMSVADSTQHASSIVTVKAAQTPSQLQIETSTLAQASVNTPYSQGVIASGGTPPYQWTIVSGSLPNGISLQPVSGALTGTATKTGQFTFTAKATDAVSNSAQQQFTIAVSSAADGAYDGPAELPRVYLATAMSDSPAPGSTISVPPGGDLQSVLKNANCGDTVTLQAGAVFSSGPYTLPNKPCDDQHWIIIRTSAPDTSLPPEGVRMTPCYAGVSHLYGRPVLNCTSTTRVLATISYSGTGNGPLIFADGANHYRLIGLEVTRAANDGKSVVTLVAHEEDGSMSHIILDRLYIHGTAGDETRRGVSFSGGTSMAIQDSYVSDLHCSVRGGCMDSQAVSGGTGSLPMGPYKIVNNFLEAAAENILFGGDTATQTPTDIEIRFNHLFKPMFWLEGQPGFTAPAFIVKNHFELKNAQRVLFDSNLLEDNWGGFSQHGYSVVLTPKNQDANGQNVCPLCQVTDVTIRYVMMSHVGGGFITGNGTSGSGGLAYAGERYSIHDVIADDIDKTVYAGRGMFAQVGTRPQPLLQDVQINHITAFPNYGLFNVGAPEPATIPGFVFTNSIVAAGESPVTSTGPYGNIQNCAYEQNPLKVWNACFSDSKFAYDAILGSPLPSSDWPGGNFFYSTSAIGFVNYHNGNGGDYHLLPSSPGVGAASDGTNLGADVDAVLSAISGVR